MAEQLTLDLGLKTFEILDIDGNVAGTIRFNPADPGFVGRWKQAEEKIQSYKQKITDLAASGTPEIDQWPVLMEASDAVKQALDYAFASPVSAVLFGGNSAFAMTDSGGMVLENVMEGLAPVMEKAIKEAAGKAQQRMQSHTAPYQGTTKGLAPGQPARPDEAAQ